MDRQFSGRKSLSCLLDDDNIEDQSPSFHHLSQLQNRRLSCYTHFPLDASPLHPLSLDESLWTRDIVMTGSTSRRVHAWQSGDCHAIGYLQASSGEVRAMVAQDGTVKMWLRIYGENSHALIKVLSFHAYPIYALALSNQNQSSSFLYSGSFDGCINFWEQEVSCQYNQGKRVLQGHQFAVLCLVAIENFVISGSEDATIRIWRRSLEDRKAGCAHECLTVLEGHRGPVRCLSAFSQKDKFVVSFLVFSASLDQTFKVWRVKLLQEMKSSSGEGEDDKERKKSVEIENGPVLSPSWVKRKLQSRSVNSV
uniref:Uncharacterized protein n=1 Tax=Chenopodium quinoa TaxID=63459 RepID=A0A803MJF3_CHEQI